MIFHHGISISRVATGIYWYLAPFIGEGNGNPLQYSCLENPMDGGAWWAAVHGVARSRIQLSDFTFTFHFHALEKEMATHSSVLAWRIPGTMEPGRLPSMGSHRVRHDWINLAAAAAAVDYDGYSISPKGFFPTVIAIMVIWIEFTHCGLFQFTPKLTGGSDSGILQITACTLCPRVCEILCMPF